MTDEKRYLYAVYEGGFGKERRPKLYRHEIERESQKQIRLAGGHAGLAFGCRALFDPASMKYRGVARFPRAAWHLYLEAARQARTNAQAQIARAEKQIEEASTVIGLHADDSDDMWPLAYDA
jgi:hypothetical protein